MLVVVRDSVDVSSANSSMPDGDVCAHEDVSDDCGVGCDEEVSFVEDIQVVEIHDVSVSTH